MKNFILFFNILFCFSCAKEKSHEQSFKEEQPIIKKTRKILSRYERLKKEKSISLEKYFPYASCIKFPGSVPVDTIYSDNLKRSDSIIIGYIYEIHKDSMNQSCLKFYRFHEQPKLGENYSLGEEYHQFDSTLDAIIYENKNSFDTLLNIRSDHDDSKIFRVDAYFNDIDSYLIYNQGYESYSHLLINRKTGIKLRIEGEPQFNPSRNMFAASNLGEMGMGGSFSIYTCENDSIKTYYKNRENSPSSNYFYKNNLNLIWVSETAFIYEMGDEGKGKMYAFQMNNAP